MYVDRCVNRNIVCHMDTNQSLIRIKYNNVYDYTFSIYWNRYGNRDIFQPHFWTIVSIENRITSRGTLETISGAYYRRACCRYTVLYIKLYRYSIIGIHVIWLEWLVDITRLSFSPPIYLTKCLSTVLFFHFYIDHSSIIITVVSVVRMWINVGRKTRVRQLAFKQHSLTETRTSRNKIVYR